MGWFVDLDYARFVAANIWTRADNTDGCSALDAWFDRWKPQLLVFADCSADMAVKLYSLLAPPEALEELPESVAVVTS